MRCHETRTKGKCGQLPGGHQENGPEVLTAPSCLSEHTQQGGRGCKPGTVSLLLEVCLSLKGCFPSLCAGVLCLSVTELLPPLPCSVGLLWRFPTLFDADKCLSPFLCHCHILSALCKGRALFSSLILSSEMQLPTHTIKCFLYPEKLSWLPECSFSAANPTKASTSVLLIGRDSACLSRFVT